MVLRENIGNAIKNARSFAGFTQERLAELVNVSPTYIRHLETGRRTPSVTILYDIAINLNMSVDDIFFPSNSETEILREKIERKLNACSVYELNIINATLEAIINKDETSL